MVAAGFGLLLARLREPLEPLLGPPRLVPVVSGVVAGAAVTGAFSSLGPLAMTLTGYAGVLLATLAAAYLTGWRRGLFLPVAAAAGIVMAALCVVQLVAGARWGQLSLLLLLTALPTVLGRRPPSGRAPGRTADRHRLPRGAVLLAAPRRRARPGTPAAVLLTLLYAVAMAVGSRLDAGSRRATARAAAVAGAGRGVPAGRRPRARVAGRRPRRAGRVHAGLGLADRTAPPDGGRREGLPRRVAGRGRTARAGRLGRRRDRRAGHRRVVHPPGRAGLLSPRDPGCGTAPRGRPGGQGSWSRPCRRRCSPSPRPTGRERCGC